MRGPLRVRTRAEVPQTEWDAFADASSEAWLWHRSDLIAAQTFWPGRSDASFAVCDGADRVLAVMPLHRTRARIARSVDIVRFNSLGGHACADMLQPDCRSDVLSAMEAELNLLMRREGAFSCELQIAPLTPCLRDPGRGAGNPALALGFADCSTHTWMVDLSRPADEIRRNYSALTRRELRRSQSRSITIREAHGSRDLETYYRLHLETYGRTGARPFPIAYFQAIFETCVPARLARILFAERAGTVVAAQNTAVYKKGAVYWTGASATDKAAGENRMLFDAQIMAARSAGCVRYETGEAFPETASEKERGLSQFKRSFGASLEAYYRGMRPASNPLFRALWELRKLLPRRALEFS
jgi:hypothetical protein